jgi:hypothetical protein
VTIGTFEIREGIDTNTGRFYLNYGEHRCMKIGTVCVVVWVVLLIAIIAPVVLAGV